MEAVLGIFNSPIALTVVMIACQFVPGLRKVIANAVVPFLTTLLALLAKVVAPEAAHAAALVPALDIPLQAGIGGFVAGLGGALVTAAQGYLLNRMFFWPGKTLPNLPADSLNTLAWVKGKK